MLDSQHLSLSSFMREAIYDPDASVSPAKFWVNMVSKDAYFTGSGGGRSINLLKSLNRVRGGTP